jgi:SAM-dependent methyltransferase
LKDIAILISPVAAGAYFKDTLAVARAELALVLGDLTPEHWQVGALDFFVVSLSDEQQQSVMMLSFVQGLFERHGGQLIPLDIKHNYLLHEDFVFGSKYKGKTNEHLTQLLVNVGLRSIDVPDGQTPKLLDPMCGRGTTLLWALRYGLNAKGIEQDAKALDDIRQHLKKWTKLHRQKHKLTDGFVGENKKRSHGKFIEFQVEDRSVRFISGDSRIADQLIKNEKFDLIVSDLPYGVQHFTTDNTRNPIAVIEQSIDAWSALLKKNGAIVLAFNSYIPKRRALIELFEHNGFVASPFSAPHRMSESIVRDVVVFKRATS